MWEKYRRKTVYASDFEEERPDPTEEVSPDLHQERGA